MVVTGPAGIGKSTLLDAMAAEARRADTTVTAGRATELDRAVPFTTLLSALRHDELALSQLTDDDPRFHRIDRIGAAIEELVRRRRLLIAVDDAHWADEASALALRVLVPALTGSPVLWLLSRRPVPARSPGQDALDWLIGEGATEHRLGPLADAAVAQLCGDVLGARPDATVLALAARGGGNPFLIQQLLISLRDSGRVKLAAGRASVVGDDLPDSFLAAVERRLGGLSPETHTVLEIGSVFGRPFTLHSVAQVAGRPAGTLVGAAEEAVRAGLLVDRGQHLAFRHDLLREAIYDRISGPVRAVRHRDTADVLRAQQRPAAEVAEHLLRAGQHGDHAVKVLRDAAAQVADAAPGTAADLLLQALEMLSQHDPTRFELVGYAVRLLASAGRLREAQQLGEAALPARMEPAAEATLLLGLSEAFKHSGHNHAVVELTGRALGRGGLPAAVTAQLLAIRAHALLATGDLDAADQAAAEAVSRGVAAPEPGATVFGGVARSVVARARGQLDQAIAYAQEAVQTADELGGARHRHPRLWLGRALSGADRFEEAERVYAAGQQEADLLATRWSQPLWHHNRAALVAARGHLADAQAWAEAGLRVAEQLAAWQMTVPLHALLSRLAVHRGALHEAAGHLQTAEQLIASGVTSASEGLWWAKGMLQEARGQDAAALGTLAGLIEQLPRRLLLFANEPNAAPALVRLAQRAGASDLAAAVAAAIRRLAAANPEVPSVTGAATHATGLLHRDRRRLLTAVADLRASPGPLALASALEDLAALERAAGEPGRAAASLTEAHDLYHRCGAAAGAARTRRRLAALGERVPASAAKPSAAPSVSELTRSELRVVRLVAQGLTNREIAERLHLSRHTVDSHLRHVFVKLDVDSRVKLTRLYLAHQSS